MAVIAAESEAKDSRALTALLARQWVTCLPSIVPSLLADLVDSTQASPDRPRALRLILVSGEKLSCRLVACLRRLWGAELRVINQYGPSETTMTATYFEVPTNTHDGLKQQGLPLGRPATARRVYVLDRHLQPQPPGAIGEIWIAGNYLTRAMAADLPHELPELPVQYGDFTHWQQRFFASQAFEREHTYWREKLAGVPTLLNLPTDWPRPSRPRHRGAIHSFVIELPLSECLKHLARGERVTNFMLLLTGFEAILARYSGERDTPFEILLTRIWYELLGVDDITRDDNFFERGGHSLLALQAVARIEQVFDITVSLRHFFERPVLKDMAAWLASQTGGQANKEGTIIRTVGREAPLPLSFAQRRLWFIQQMQPENTHFNMSFPYRFRGAFDARHFGLALLDLVTRHEILRARFSADHGDPRQRFDAPERFAAPLIDLSGLAETDLLQHALRLIRAREQRPFQLHCGRLFRAVMFHLGPRDHVLHLLVHHVVFDGWSVDLLHGDLLALYRARLTNRAAVLPPLPIQYADYAYWEHHQGRAALAAELDYWTRRLSGPLPPLPLPADP